MTNLNEQEVLLGEGVSMDTDVVIAGAGPAGLMLATELALAGVEAIVVETLKTRSGQSKATNLQPRYR